MRKFVSYSSSMLCCGGAPTSPVVFSDPSFTSSKGTISGLCPNTSSHKLTVATPVPVREVSTRVVFLCLSFMSRTTSASCSCHRFLGPTRVSSCLVYPGEQNCRGWISKGSFSTNFRYVFHQMLQLSRSHHRISGRVPDLVTDAPRVA